MAVERTVGRRREEETECRIGYKGLLSEQRAIKRIEGRRENRRP
jgi:hypothetical protein